MIEPIKIGKNKKENSLAGGDTYLPQIMRESVSPKKQKKQQLDN
jgi:hypothetical protein